MERICSYTPKIPTTMTEGYNSVTHIHFLVNFDFSPLLCFSWLDFHNSLAQIYEKTTS